MSNTLTREQVELELMRLLNGVGVGGNILAHDAALRATIERQAQELEQLQATLAAREEYIKELNQQIEAWRDT